MINKWWICFCSGLDPHFTSWIPAGDSCMALPGHGAGDEWIFLYHWWSVWGQQSQSDSSTTWKQYNSGLSFQNHQFLYSPVQPKLPCLCPSCVDHRVHSCQRTASLQPSWPPRQSLLLFTNPEEATSNSTDLSSKLADPPIMSAQWRRFPHFRVPNTVQSPLQPRSSARNLQVMLLQDCQVVHSQHPQAQ